MAFGIELNSTGKKNNGYELYNNGYTAGSKHVYHVILGAFENSRIIKACNT